MFANITIIQASAGTGKTYTLVEHCIELLKTGYTPENIVAVTFTEKAAVELKQRLRQKLLQTPDSTVAYDLRDMANRIPESLIGTVHSVCARLMRDYALEAGLSPAVTVLPEEDSKHLFAVASAPATENWAETIAPLYDALNLNAVWSPDKSRREKTPGWLETVRNMVTMARSNGLSTDKFGDCAKQSWDSFKSLFPKPMTPEEAAALERELEAELARCKGTPVVPAAGKNLSEAASKYNDFLAGLPAQCAHMLWSDWIQVARKTIGTKQDEAYATLRELGAKVYSHPHFQHDVETLITSLFACAAESLEYYRTHKAEAGLVDFADLEQQAAIMLRNPDILERLRPRCKVLLVDEFQDTNPMQLDIFLRLLTVAERAVWVGDSKQSIYGFRGADAQLMDEVVRHIRTNNDAIKNLSDCYRTLEPLVKFTNSYFTAAGIIPENLQIKAKRTAGTFPSLHWWWVQKQDKQHNKANTTGAIAAGVRDLLTDGTTTVRRKVAEDEIDCPVTPADIAVLCRSNTACREMAEALEALGVRAKVARDDLLACPEIRLVCNLLRLTLDARDTLATAEILDIIGEDWFDAAHAARNAEIGARNELFAPLFATVLADLRSRLAELSPAELLDFLLQHTDITTELNRWPNAAARLANTEALRGKLQEYEHSCRSRGEATTLHGCLRWLESNNPPQAAGGSEAVHVGTYHGAKGLEWPIVILQNLDGKAKDSLFGLTVECQSFTVSDPLQGRLLRYWPNIWGKSKPDLNPFNKPEEICTANEHIARAEELRLLYVGMTRARDALILVGKEEDKKAGVDKKPGKDKKPEEDKKPEKDWLARGLGEISLTPPSADNEQGRIGVGDESFPVAVRRICADQRNIPSHETGESITPMPPVSQPPSAEQASPAEREAPSASIPAFSWQAHTLGDAFSVGDEDRGMELGNTLHAWFAVDLLSTAAQPERLERAQRHVSMWNAPLAPEALLTMTDRLRDFMSKRGAGNWRTEWPVAALATVPTSTTRAGEAGVASLCENFRLDALYVTPDALRIVDHKSDQLKNPEAVANVVKTHAEQLARYADILRRLHPEPISCWLHLPLAGLLLELHEKRP